VVWTLGEPEHILVHKANGAGPDPGKIASRPAWDIFQAEVIQKLRLLNNSIIKALPKLQFLGELL
jgi:hypothetical protein